MDLSQIRKLIGLVKGTDITEIEVTEGDQTVRISRQTQTIMMQQAPSMMPQMMAAPQASAPAAPQAAAPAAAQKNDEHVVKSPMVGTFYAAASPDAAPFVKVGDRVSKGDVLCIIEAMKMMNEIEAEYSGVVESILVDNASPLEYGQPIFVITPQA
ncbi:acetyl-CoA carboxylase biotin carboxyl carrier protein [Mariprofundus erugo]|uniref:Biotin carboxyl carrier protein of acetyl-CoA carboxylase n=1 Tax=Mariprofundus erugo TaxID=2528639 RepID=A0A5R9GU63_9PROT|nr:acetyl-CoA carboxylase biotin carboxyl carrier protein [Mariprofundus erugo]TLS67807.1 acetyl-CoA carboxylase biotin carboxyl carrier protein [Mariprofundus erugo]TLS75929.1 acetyl-CoA carboxylase biotin carboxyl carrier protein [Mariprofundus erugo]